MKTTKAFLTAAIAAALCAACAAPGEPVSGVRARTEVSVKPFQALGDVFRSATAPTPNT